MRRPLAFLLILLLPSPLLAQDWARFRGPNGSGSSSATKLPATLERDKDLRWRAPLAPGHSSPVLTRETVFTTGADAEALIVSAHALADGKPRWERRLVRARTQEVYPANGSAAPSPCTDGTNVYAFFPELGLVSFDSAGEERWRLPLGPFVSFYGMASSPILAGDTLVLLCDQQQGSFLLGVDSASGKQRWRTERKGLIECWTTPILQPAAQPSSILVFGTFTVSAYALADGRELWRAGKVGYTPVCSPVLWERSEGALLFTSVPFHAEGGAMPSFEAMAEADADKDGKLARAELAGSDYGEHFGWADADQDGQITPAEWAFICDGMSSKDYGLVAFALGAQEPKELWRHKRSLPAIATPLLHDGLLFLVKSGGMLTVLEATSGEELGFRRLEEAGGEYDASPVAGDGKLYLASQEGRLSVLTLAPEPALLASTDLGEPIHATPALAKGMLLVRTDAALYCFGARD